MNNKLKNELVNRNIMTGEFSFMSNKEIINIIDFMNKDSEFLNSLGISENKNDKYEIVESLLDWTEKISDPGLFKALIKFAFPVDDKLMNKILDKIDESLKIDDKLMEEIGERADIIRIGSRNTWKIDPKTLKVLEFDQAKKLLEREKKSSGNRKELLEREKELDELIQESQKTFSSCDHLGKWYETSKLKKKFDDLNDKASFSLKTINRMLKKSDFSSVNPFDISLLINEKLSESYCCSKNDIDEFLGIILGNHMEFDFIPWGVNLLDLYDICYGLFSRLEKYQQNRSYLNRLYKIMLHKFFRESVYSNKGILDHMAKTKTEFKIKSLAAKLLESYLSDTKSGGTYCSGLGTTGYESNSTPDASNSLVYVFLYGFESMDFCGVDKQTKNKIFVDEIIEKIGSSNSYGDRRWGYLLSSCFEILALNNYKIDEITLRKLVNGTIRLFSNPFAFEKFPDDFSAISKVILEKLEKLYDRKGKSFVHVVKEAWKDFGNVNAVIFLDGHEKRFVFQNKQNKKQSCDTLEKTEAFLTRYKNVSEYCKQVRDLYEQLEKTELTKDDMAKINKIPDIKILDSKTTEQKENITESSTSILIETAEECHHCDECARRTSRMFYETKNGYKIETEDIVKSERKIEPEIKPLGKMATIDNISKEVKRVIEKLINGKNVNEKSAVNYICEGIMMVPSNVLSGELKNEYCNCFRKALELPNAWETIIIYLTGFLFFLKGKFKECQLCFDNPKKAKKRFGLEDGLKKLNKIKANDRKPKFNLTENRNEIRILE